MFKLVLIRPSMYHADLLFPDGPRLSIPLGLLYLGGAFKDSPQVAVSIIDAFAYPDMQALSKSKPPFLFGQNTQRVIEQLEALAPDAIGISSTALPFFNPGIELITAIKKRWPTVFVMAGGGDVTARSKHYFEAAPELDAVIQGEGEEALIELISALRAKKEWHHIANVGYIQHGTYLQNAPRAICPTPDRYRPDFSLIDLEHYFSLGKQGFLSRVSFQYPQSHRAVHLVTSRGCPYSCRFCSIHLHMGRTYRSHSSTFILELLETLKRDYAIQHIYFEDDHLLLQRERLIEILSGMIERKLNLTWSTPNGVRADCIDSDLARLMKASGCLYLIFGIESGNQKTLDYVNKNLDLKEVETSIAACRSNGIDAFGFFIFGFPNETLSDIQVTLDYAMHLYKKYHFTPLIHLFKPLWGTDLHKELTRTNPQQIIDTSNIFGPRDYNIPHFLFGPKMIETDHFTLNDLASIYRKYLTMIARRAFLYWWLDTIKRPHILTVHLLILLRDLIKKPRSFSKILSIYFWHIWIYPNATLDQFNRGVVRHLSKFLEPHSPQQTTKSK